MNRNFSTVTAYTSFLFSSIYVESSVRADCFPVRHTQISDDSLYRVRQLSVREGCDALLYLKLIPGMRYVVVWTDHMVLLDDDYDERDV
jgi:hypothetical protein